MASDKWAAAYGLLGAIVGGAATFAGAYWTGHQSQSAQQVVSDRTAYVEYAAAADQYKYNLVLIQDALSNHNNADYAQIRISLIAEVAPLYSDETQVLLVAPSNIDNDATKILGALFSVAIPINSSSADSEYLAEAIKSGNAWLSQFSDDTQRQLNPNKGG